MSTGTATFPASYAPWMRSVMALAIREAQRDAAVRAGEPAPPGFKPLPDSLLDLKTPGEAIVAVIPIPTEDAQALAEQWPIVPRDTDLRFPGYGERANALRVAERPHTNGADK